MIAVARMGLRLAVIAVCVTLAAATTGYSEQAPVAGGSASFPPAGTAHPLTLADPELRDILAHFKHRDDVRPVSPAVADFAAGSVAYPAYAFGYVRPYWPPVIVAHPPRPIVPLFAPFFVPGVPAFFCTPPIQMIWPGR